MSNVDLIVLTRGHIPGGTKGEIVNTFRDCYRRFGSRVPYKVSILIAETEGIRHDFLREEQSMMGITTVEDEDSVCSYNSWRGYPTISVSVERLKEFSKPARQGALRHDAAHTVLHNSLEYNIFKIPDACRQIATIKGINFETLEQVLRNLSSAIKDCEASKFLISHDFIDCQAAFLLEWIPSPADKSIFKSTQMNRQTKFIHQAALLKPILLAEPLLAIPKSRKISLERQIFLGRKIEELIEDMAEYDRNKLLQVASTITGNLTEDTHSNVDAAMHHIMTLA